MCMFPLHFHRGSRYLPQKEQGINAILSTMSADIRNSKTSLCSGSAVFAYFKNQAPYSLKEPTVSTTETVSFPNFITSVQLLIF